MRANHKWFRSFRLNVEDLQPAKYSLSRVRHTTKLAKWLAGLSGASLVLSFGFYIPAYLSVLSVKDDCASLQFVADAIKAATQFIEFSLGAGFLALGAIIWPVVIGFFRNNSRRRKMKPPLEPGSEFDGWSEIKVGFLGHFPQAAFVSFSIFALSVLILALILTGHNYGKPEELQKEWHRFELSCLQQTP